MVYLQPSMNPHQINCVLPIVLRHVTEENKYVNITIHDTIQLLFTPVQVRTTLMWVGISFYIMVFFLATYCWLSSSWYFGGSTPGMMLLRNIGCDESQNILKKLDRRRSWINTDLELVMALVYVNRYRLKFIE